MNGTNLIEPGGSAYFTVIDGGVQTVSSGFAGDTVINGGFQDVYAGGVASATTVGAGGTNDVADGIASASVVNAGGKEEVLSAGTVIGATVNKGGDEIILGFASGVTVGSGGTETVSAGGVASGSIIHSGGTLDLPFLAFSSAGFATVDGGDLLTVTQGANSYQQQLAGSYGGLLFHEGPDSGTGTLVTVDDTPCFTEGHAS